MAVVVASSGVSIRTTAVNDVTLPPPASAVTTTDMRGRRPAAIPLMANVSSPVSRATRAFHRRRIRAAESPCDEVRTMDAFERFGDCGAYAKQHRAFGGPVARRTRTVFFAGQHDERLPAARTSPSIEDRHCSPVEVARHAAFDPGTSRLRKRTLANVPAPSLRDCRGAAVGVEIVDRNACASRYFAAGDVRRCFRRRDVIGRDRVAEHRKRARTTDVLERLRLFGHAVEVRRFLMYSLFGSR